MQENLQEKIFTLMIFLLKDGRTEIILMLKHSMFHKAGMMPGIMVNTFLLPQHQLKIFCLPMSYSRRNLKI